MLNGLIGLLIGDKIKHSQNQRVSSYVGQLVGLVGRLQATRAEIVQRFQCLSAYRSCRYYVGGCRNDKPDPQRRRADLGISHGPLCFGASR